METTDRVETETPFSMGTGCTAILSSDQFKTIMSRKDSSPSFTQNPMQSRSLTSSRPGVSRVKAEREATTAITMKILVLMCILIET